MRVHILDDWHDTLRGLPCFERLAGHEVTVWTDAATGPALAERLQGAEALVLFRERTPITEPLLAALPGLKLISQRSVYPHVDVAACTRHGVLLSSNMGKDGPNVAAAELTFGLILSALRQIPQQMAACKAGDWQIGVGKTAAGRTLGLYGYGRIAQLVAGYARAFGMKVIWWASDEGRARARADGETVAESREAFFANSDVVSLHLRLAEATKGIVTSADLAQMKSTSLLVNTARAGLIAPGALLQALEAGQPGMAAVDVFDVEPQRDAQDPLLAHPRLICTPHIGFVTEEELDRQFADIFDQVNAYAAGAPIHMINPEVLTPSA